MRVTLDYGRNGLDVDLPDDVCILRPRYVTGLADEEESIREAIRNPIGSLPLVSKVYPGNKVVVVHTDITRATPNKRILPVLLSELERAGVSRQDISFLNGLGTHRPQTETELRQMLGDDIVDGYRCLQHDSHDEQNLIPLGKTSWGNPIRVNRQYLEADVRILTGFIEPHFFAGYSGGPKAVLPSLAGFESVGSNHSAANIAHPNATWGKTEGNPIWEEMKEVALRTNPTFMLNVTLNVDGHITGVFAGDMLVAHAAGCAFIAQTAMVPVGEPFDIIITTNSGYPLDLNLYQSVKGMSAAAQIVRQGGAIIMATACEDGVPDHGGYAELLQRGGSPQGVLDMVTSPGFNQPDQWQVQIQAMVQSWADVFIYSEGLTDDQIRRALLMPCRDISHTLAQLASRLNHKASIAVLPEGPQTIPYVTDR
jgi:nickel-dependent lactate racemase